MEREAEHGAERGQNCAVVSAKSALARLAERICKRCGSAFKPTSFCQRYCGKQRIKGTCSWSQGNEARTRFLQEHPEKTLLYRQTFARRNPLYEARRNFLRRLALYGISEETFMRLVEQQNGLCAICNGLPGMKGLQIDHCHNTKQVRGLLCMTCNTRLGHIESEWLNRAQQYIAKQRHPAWL